MSHGKAMGIKICQFQLHTGYIQEEETSLQFAKYIVFKNMTKFNEIILIGFLLFFDS